MATWSQFGIVNHIQKCPDLHIHSQCTSWATKCPVNSSSSRMESCNGTFLQLNHTWTLISRTPYVHIIGSKLIGVQDKTETWWIFKQTKSSCCCKRISSYWWDWLYWNLFFNCQTRNHTNDHHYNTSSRITYYSSYYSLADIKNAFLHSNITEDIYRKEPLGVTNPQHPTYVWKPHRTLYGFKQALHAWFDCFSIFYLKYEFIRSLVYLYLFVFHFEYGFLMFFYSIYWWYIIHEICRSSDVFLNIFF